MVQIGITSIGILNGIVGDAAFSGAVRAAGSSPRFPIRNRAAEITATGLVDVGVTFY